MAEPWTREWKEERLRELEEAWSVCAQCPLSQSRRNVVFGTGNPDAKLMFIAEAPGEDEDETGYPFEGASGVLLKTLLAEAEIEWDDIYVTNIVGCRPTDENGKNRDPSVKERDACLPRVHEIIYLVDPWLIVPLGKVSLKALAKGRDWAITEHRGTVFSSPGGLFKINGEKNSVEIKGRVFPRTSADKVKVHLEYDMIPILHPAYLLREDSIDYKKGVTFQPDGVIQKTYSDIRRIKRYLNFLEKQYQVIPSFEQR